MKLVRRQFLRLAGLGAALPWTYTAAAAAAYPDRPVRLIVPFAAGGPTDIVARLIAQKLSESWGQQVYVENVAGASGNIGTRTVARAAPDGYTLIAIPGGHASAAALYNKLPYRTIDDFSPISMVAEYPFVFVTYPDHPLQSMAQLLAAARSRTTPLFYGTPGIGTTHHLLVELLSRTAGVRFEHVPYRGSAPVVADLLGKRIDFMVDPPTQVATLARENKLRALAVTDRTRFFGLPDIPTVIETGVADYVATSWQGLAAPAGVPPSIVTRLNAEVTALLSEPRVIDQLRALGNNPRATSADQFKDRIGADVTKWTDVVTTAKIERL